MVTWPKVTERGFEPKSLFPEQVHLTTGTNLCVPGQGFVAYMHKNEIVGSQVYFIIFCAIVPVYMFPAALNERFRLHSLSSCREFIILCIISTSHQYLLTLWSGGGLCLQLHLAHWVFFCCCSIIFFEHGCLLNLSLLYLILIVTCLGGGEHSQNMNFLNHLDFKFFHLLL